MHEKENKKQQRILSLPEFNWWLSPFQSHLFNIITKPICQDKILKNNIIRMVIFKKKKKSFK